jgi:hypothetical protein
MRFLEISDLPEEWLNTLSTIRDCPYNCYGGREEFSTEPAKKPGNIDTFSSNYTKFIFIILQISDLESVIWTISNGRQCIQPLLWQI